MIGLIFYVCLTICPTSPTLPYSTWGFWTLNTQNSEVVSFVDETCQRYNVEAKQVKEILMEDYLHRINIYKPKTKVTRGKALNHMLGWCRYWRNNSDRLRLTHATLAKHSKAECFFRSLERR